MVFTNTVRNFFPPPIITNALNIFLQVVTETEFIARSNDLQEILSSGKIADYCQKKIDDAGSVYEEDIWSFLKVFSPCLLYFS